MSAAGIVGPMGPAAQPTVADLVRARADDHDRRCSSRAARGRGPRSCASGAPRRAALPGASTAPVRSTSACCSKRRPSTSSSSVGAALAGAVVVGINPTRRGEELARDIRHTDCQLVVTDASTRPLLDGLDLGVAADRVLVVDADRRRARRSTASSAVDPPHGAAGARRPVPADLHVGLDRRAEGGADDPGPGRRACGAGSLVRARRRPLLRDAAVPRQRAERRCVFPALARRRDDRAARAVLGVGSSCPTSARYGATFFNTVGRALSYILATPDRPTTTRDNPLQVRARPRVVAADMARVPDALRLLGLRRATARARTRSS